MSRYLNDFKIEITYIEQLSEEAMMLIYKVKDEFVKENSSSSMILALWTTASAREHLVRAVLKLLENSDVRILYMGK